MESHQTVPIADGGLEQAHVGVFTDPVSKAGGCTRVGFEAVDSWVREEGQEAVGILSVIAADIEDDRVGSGYEALEHISGKLGVLDSRQTHELARD